MAGYSGGMAAVTQRRAAPRRAPPARSATRSPAGCTADVLFVDVDGTLTRADLSLESFVRVARLGLLPALRLILVLLLHGRAAAKTLAARLDPVDPAGLPYRPEVLDLIRKAAAEGRPVVLASASHRRNVRRIARHFGLDDAPVATTRRRNLKGAAKLSAIRARIGDGATFGYIGDSRADAPVWRAAAQAWTTDYRPHGSRVVHLGPPRRSAWQVVAQALRPHQWAKNGLVLVPLVTSALFLSPPHVLAALGAMACMSLIASAIYLVNDVLDIDADRAHRTKHARPLAAGELSIPVALALSVLLATTALAAGWLIEGLPLLAWLGIYMAVSVAYSVRLKAAMVADALVLAMLYTLRLLVGSAAIGVQLSYWLLLFSVFLFLSLAYLKRYIEVRDAPDLHRLVRGRGYVAGDREIIIASGLAAGMVSVLILALFAHEPEATRTYAAPDLLLLLCIPLIYWLNRIWMMARRGEVETDPVAFAVRDRRSLLVGAVMAALFLMAQFGPHIGLLAALGLGSAIVAH